MASDLCLLRGTKRKLSQRTLLQFSFCPKLKSSRCESEGVHAGTSDVVQVIEPAKNNLQLGSIGADEVTCAKSQCEMSRSYDGTSLKSSLVFGSIIQHSKTFTEKIYIDDDADEMTDASSEPFGSGASDVDVEGILDDLSGTTLETCIVGRKYVDAAEAVAGTSICFLRDPYNIKDPNAIKVLPAIFVCFFLSMFGANSGIVNVWSTMDRLHPQMLALEKS